MKNKTILALLLGILVAAVSCDEVIDKLNIAFNSEPHVFDFYVDPVGAGTHTLDTVLVPTDIKSEMEKHGASVDLIESAHITSAKFTVKAGEPNFNKLESITVVIVIFDNDGNVILNETLAEIDNIPDGVTTIEPTITSTNLKEYIKQANYYVILKAEVSDEIEEQVTIEAELEYKISI